MLDTKLESRTFLLLLAVVTLAFGWLLLPFYGAVFWGTILAIIFAPVQRRLQVRLRDRKNLAALITLLICVLIVIIPVIFIAGSLVQEGASVYQRVKSGELNFAAYLQQAVAALPPSVHQWLERFDLANLSSLQEKLSSVAMQASQVVATKAFSIGQNTLDFVISFGIMLYLLFFLLRDGRVLGRRIKQSGAAEPGTQAPPVRQVHHGDPRHGEGQHRRGCHQGALGGLIFWLLGIEGALLWGTLMAFLSLLPAIGAALIWAPVAAYFLLTGAIWQGVVLILFCVVVIGLVDNILRPILVGKDTKMPDYVVLISTLGGMALFGLNGFVIGPLIAALFMASWDLFTGREEEPQA